MSLLLTLLLLIGSTVSDGFVLSLCCRLVNENKTVLRKLSFFSRSIFAQLLCCDSCYSCIYCYSMYKNTGLFGRSLFTSHCVCERLLFGFTWNTVSLFIRQKFLHLSVFICVLSLYCKWFTCGDMGSKESEFPGLREPVWANRACTFVARMWIWRDGFVCVLFNVIPLSAWKYPNAALQTGMWFSMALLNQNTSDIDGSQKWTSSFYLLVSYSSGHGWK